MNHPEFTTNESTEKFLIDVALVTNLYAEISAADGLDKAAVRLTTVHQAKDSNIRRS